MEDKKLACLKLADNYWRKTFYAEKPLKLEYAKELHGFGLLSLTQLAKIVRLTAVELTRDGLKPNSNGGRFEPETLTALISMRNSRVLGEKVPVRLIELCVEGGTSWSCAAKLTGVPFSTYYKNVPATGVSTIPVVKVSPKDNVAIVRAVRAGANRALLAEQYKISVNHVERIVKAHESI